MHSNEKERRVRAARDRAVFALTLTATTIIMILALWLVEILVVPS